MDEILTQVAYVNQLRDAWNTINTTAQHMLSSMAIAALGIASAGHYGGQMTKPSRYHVTGVSAAYANSLRTNAPIQAGHNEPKQDFGKIWVPAWKKGHQSPIVDTKGKIFQLMEAEVQSAKMATSGIETPVARNQERYENRLHTSLPIRATAIPPDIWSVTNAAGSNTRESSFFSSPIKNISTPGIVPPLAHKADQQPNAGLFEIATGNMENPHFLAIKPWKQESAPTWRHVPQMLSILNPAARGIAQQAQPTIPDFLQPRTIIDAQKERITSASVDRRETNPSGATININTPLIGTFNINTGNINESYEKIKQEILTVMLEVFQRATPAH